MATNNDDLFYRMTDGKEINFSEHLRKIVEQELAKAEDRFFYRIVAWFDEEKSPQTEENIVPNDGDIERIVDHVVAKIHQRSTL